MFNHVEVNYSSKLSPGRLIFVQDQKLFDLDFLNWLPGRQFSVSRFDGYDRFIVVNSSAFSHAS